MEATDKAFVTCPCCGKETFPVHTELDDKIVELFMACVLAEQPFRYTYELFGGKVLVTCRQPSATEQTVIGRLGIKLASVKDEQLRSQVNVMLMRMAALYPIIQIVVQANGQQKTYDVHQLCVDLQEKLMGAETIDKALIQDCMNQLDDVKNVSSIPMTVLNKVLDTHSNINNLLITAGFDNAFYKGIPHV